MDKNIEDLLKEIDKMAGENGLKPSEIYNELFESKTIIEEVFSKLEKAAILLEDWVEEYNFSANPDPKAALKYSQNLHVDKDIHGEESCSWYYEYDRIFRFIDIATDYVLDSKKMLEEAMNK